jgi:hypothetical protein
VPALSRRAARHTLTWWLGAASLSSFGVYWAMLVPSFLVWGPWKEPPLPLEIAMTVLFAVFMGTGLAVLWRDWRKRRPRG